MLILSVREDRSYRKVLFNQLSIKIIFFSTKDSLNSYHVQKINENELKHNKPLLFQFFNADADAIKKIYSQLRNSLFRLLDRS